MSEYMTKIFFLQMKNSRLIIKNDDKKWNKKDVYILFLLY